MAVDNWKESAVMFYCAASILTVLLFGGVLIHIISRNKERRRNCLRCLCYLCYHEALSNDYDDINREESDGLLSDNGKAEMFSIDGSDDENNDEIEVNIELSDTSTPL